MSDLDRDAIGALHRLAEAHAFRHEARVLQATRDIDEVQRKIADLTRPATEQTSYAAALAQHHYAEWTRRRLVSLRDDLAKLDKRRAALVREAATARARTNILSELYERAIHEHRRKRQKASLEAIAMQPLTSPDERCR